MKILIENNQSRYVTIPQDIFQDERLCLRDLGLLLTLISFPNNEIISKKELYNILPNDSYHTIERSLKNLEISGYLNRIQVRDGSGKFMCYKWAISSVPQYNSTDIERLDKVIQPEAILQESPPIILNVDWGKSV